MGVNDVSWLACGPSSSVQVPLTSQPPDRVAPGKVAAIGRSTDSQWSAQVSRQHGEVVATSDGRIWYRDLSTGGTYVLDGTSRRLPRDQWTDVTGLDLGLGETAPAHRLQFKRHGGAEPVPLWSQRAHAEDPGPAVSLLHHAGAHARIGRIVDPKPSAVQSYLNESTQVIPVDPEDAKTTQQTWDMVPERLADIADDVSSGYKISIDHQPVTLPLNGKPVPFGSDPSLAGQGGLVVNLQGVSRIHGWVRFNPFGGHLRPDGTPQGSIEIYDGNGQGRASTNHIYLEGPGHDQVQLAPGSFQPITLQDVVKVCDHAIVISVDAAHPMYSLLH